MRQGASSGVGRIGLFFLASIVIVGFALCLGRNVFADDASPDNKMLSTMFGLNHKFEGSGTCKSCHGDPVGDPGTPPKKNSEQSIWLASDKHHSAFDTLSSDRSKDIATKGGYGDAATSAKCLACHAVNAPAALQAGSFKPSEGVTCEACHGASELWSGTDGSPHKNKGWVGKLRDADGYDAKATEVKYGLKDVVNPALRADNCAACHLAIDAKMVTAGHPQPAFEINEYAADEPKHWVDKRGDQYYTQLWAAGQVVCTREAMAELGRRVTAGAAADLIKASYDQAMAHATMFQILVTTDGGVGAEVKDDLAKAMTTLAAGPDKDAAAAVSGLADKVFTADLAAFAPDATAAGAILGKVIDGSDAAMKSYGRRGAEQAAYASHWLYLSKAWDADTKKELPDDLNAAFKGFFDNRDKPLGDDAAKFADAIAKIKANP